MSKTLLHVVMRYVFAALSVAGAIVLLEVFRTHFNSTTIALALLLVVLCAAIFWGSGPATLASALGMVGFNYFFLEPVRTLTIADPDNWVALSAFLITAIVVGQLSARARQRASEAEAGKREIERLYKELRDAFDLASRAEALKQSELLKSALLDAVTHDLRTPLTSIKASVTSLLDATSSDDDSLPLDEEGRQEFLEVINEETDRLNHFIEGLVDLARIESGEMRLRRAWGNVDEIIADALNRAAGLTSKHTINVELETELPVARVDARALSEVVYTLVNNAAKFSAAGTAIEISAFRAPNDMVEIRVEDRGPGIPRNLRERVFEKFFQVSNETEPTSGNTNGLGMGLAIARGIVEAHGGKIWVEDGKLGHGNRIAFVVPIGDEDGE